MLSLLEDGDEVILFSPNFPAYKPQLNLLNKELNIKEIPFSNNFTFALDFLEKQCSNRTKLLILNSPHNPTGKIFTTDELKFIRDLSLKYDFSLPPQSPFLGCSFGSSSSAGGG